MQAALHQNAGAAECDRFIDLLADFLQCPDISVRRTWPAIESAEGANYIANIRVIDIAVDYVGDDVVRMSLLANFVGGRADPGNVVRFEQGGTIVGGEPRAREGLIQNALNLARHVLSLLVT